MTFSARHEDVDSQGQAVPSWVARELSTCTSRSVPLGNLVRADSLRTSDTNPEHVRALADVAKKLPPILVHGRSGIVVDGVHRVCAAELRRNTFIDAWIYPGSLNDAFVLAISLNSQHGLPLTRTERSNAAMRVLRSHAQWSDRMIADITGLAAGTIRRLRRCSSDENAQPGTRIGRDGRLRPIDSQAGRLRAREFLFERPNASARSIAKEVGVSAATVLDVQRRVAAGQDVLPSQVRDTNTKRTTGTVNAVISDNSSQRLPHKLIFNESVALDALSKDPSMRLNSWGRFLLRWMIISRDGSTASDRIINSVPNHCIDTVAKLANAYSDLWKEIAKKLQDKQEGPNPTSAFATAQFGTRPFSEIEFPASEIG